MSDSEEIEDFIVSSAEHKYFDKEIDNTRTVSGVDFRGVMYSLCDVPQGFGQRERIGDRITITSIQLTTSVGLPKPEENLIPKVNHVFRVIVFIWKDDSVPGIADVLQSGTVTLTEAIPLAPLNREKKVKRKIIFDETFTQGYGLETTNLTVTSVYNNSFIVKLVEGIDRSDGVVYFTKPDLSGVNKIYLLMLSNATIDVDPVVNSCWDFTTVSRINYFDF